MLKDDILASAERLMLRRILNRLDIELSAWTILPSRQKLDVVLNEMMQSAYIIVEHINKSCNLYNLHYALNKANSVQDFKQILTAVFMNLPGYGHVSGNTEYELIVKIIKDEMHDASLNIKKYADIKCYVDSMSAEDLCMGGNLYDGVKYYYSACRALNNSRVYQHLVNMLVAPKLLETMRAHKHAVAQQKVMCRFVVDYIDKMRQQYGIHPEFSYLRVKLLQQIGLIEAELQQLASEKLYACCGGGLCFNFTHQCHIQHSIPDIRNSRHDLLRYNLTLLR